MYAAEFEYHKASSVAEAIQLLSSDPGAKLLAGGHSLLPLMKLRLSRPTTLIDIGGLADLRGISVSHNTLRIGALATHHAIASSHDIHHANPLMAEVANGIGDPAVRNRGTIGGNIAHADPASDWPTVLTALEATIEVQGPGGSRSIAASDFFQDAFTTALAENEVITAVQVPVLAGHRHEHEHGDEHEHGHQHGHTEVHGQVGEYAKMSHPASFYAVVGGAVVLNIQEGRCTSARVAVGGLTLRPTRAPSAEQALVGQQLTMESVTAACRNIASDLGDDIIGDIYASADFRREVAQVEVKHAIFHAIGLAHH